MEPNLKTTNKLVASFTALVAAIAFAASTPVPAQATEYLGTDGTWWLSLPRTSSIEVVIGEIDALSETRNDAGEYYDFTGRTFNWYVDEIGSFYLEHPSALVVHPVIILEACLAKNPHFSSCAAYYRWLKANKKI
jgi:hypothetical protein